MLYRRFRFCNINNFESAIYLTRGGNLSLFAGALKASGLSDSCWSAVADSSWLSATFLDLNDTGVDPSRNGSRGYGLTVWFFLGLFWI